MSWNRASSHTQFCLCIYVWSAHTEGSHLRMMMITHETRSHFTDSSDSGVSHWSSDEESAHVHSVWLTAAVSFLHYSASSSSCFNFITRCSAHVNMELCSWLWLVSCLWPLPLYVHVHGSWWDNPGLSYRVDNLSIILITIVAVTQSWIEVTYLGKSWPRFVI